MFTGIIIGKGVIEDRQETLSGLGLKINIGDLIKKVENGSSIAINGVCLTVKEKDGESTIFDVMPETLRKTTLAEKNIQDQVNLELALRVGDELGGHFVYGHIDGLGEVSKVEAEGENMLVSIKIPLDNKKYLAPQGAITVDGVSLTVARIIEDDFTVSLVPYTLENTILGQLKVGDKVNIEYDMLVKVIRNQ